MMLGSVARTLRKGGLSTVCNRLKRGPVSQHAVRPAQVATPCGGRHKSTAANTLEGCYQNTGDRVKQFSTSVAVSYAEEDDVCSDIIDEIDSQVMTGKMGRLFAVIQVSGKQRKITTDDIIVLDKHLTADVGEIIRLNKVMLVGGKDFTLVGRPILNAEVARVEGTVIEKTLAQTDVIFKFRKRDNYKNMRLNKEKLTFVRINKIELTSLQS